MSYVSPWSDPLYRWKQPSWMRPFRRERDEKNYRDSQLNELGITLDTLEGAIESADIDVEAHIEDDGIGHYEYGGAVGFDSRLYVEASGHGEVEVEWDNWGPADSDEMNEFDGSRSVFIPTGGGGYDGDGDFHPNGDDQDVPVKFVLQSVSAEVKRVQIKKLDGTSIGMTIYKYKAQFLYCVGEVDR